MRRKGIEALRQGVREACIKGYGGVIYAFEGAQTVFARAIGDGGQCAGEVKLLQALDGDMYRPISTGIGPILTKKRSNSGKV